jgi:hypothetical protein
MLRPFRAMVLHAGQLCDSGQGMHAPAVATQPPHETRCNMGCCCAFCCNDSWSPTACGPTCAEHVLIPDNLSKPSLSCFLPPVICAPNLQCEEVRMAAILQILIPSRSPILTALACSHVIDVPDGSGVEGARLTYKLPAAVNPTAMPP